MNLPVPPSSIINTLVERGLITKDQLKISQIEVEKSERSLEQTLLDLGFINQALLRDIKSELSGSVSIELKHALPDPSALALITVEFARRHSLIPLSLQENILTVAVVDANDLQTMDRLSHQVTGNLTLKLAVASARDITDAIDRFYGFELSIDGILNEIEGQRYAAAESDNSDVEYSQPFVRLVDAILVDAVKRSASDIHFEPEAGFLRIRYRIDGVMRQIRSLHDDYWSALSVRIKVLSELNIAEKRAPQDGRLSFAVAGSPIEFRVSVLPTIHGENIVLRILDRQKGIVPMRSLGLSEQSFSALNLMMARPEGLILVTGPTGSGKTTTLYSMLNQISDERINIMTMEDPVEYPLPLLRQTTVNEQVKLNFAEGIKAILRQDPDVILVGEIRDQQTAEMALRASMTGHQVYSTLHANSSIGSLSRLADIGVGPAAIVGNIIGIVAQRLVRKLCEHCKQSAVPDEFERSIIGECDHHYTAVGCDLCEQQGYRGRVSITEVLRFNATLEEAIAKHANASEISSIARHAGFKTLADDAVDKVCSGITSIEEASRVIDFTNRVV